MKGTYRRVTDRLNPLLDLALLALRVVPGWIFILHALSKYDMGSKNFRGFLDSLGNVPLPGLMTHLVPILELVGGIALIVGLATRPVAVLLFLEMLFTAFFAKLADMNTGVLGPGGVGGAEVDILYLAIFGTLILLGPGRVSLDALLGLERRGSATAGSAA